jgi:6-phosphogluconolactonase
MLGASRSSSNRRKRSVSQFELVKLGGPEELARAAAADFLRQQRAASASFYGLALSGGRIARLLFSAMAAGAKKEATDLGHIHYFWADERCVPPEDPESNYVVARELLLGPLGVDGERVHRIRGEWPPAEAAREGSAELGRLTSAKVQGVPVLDLIFLGMGEDGHVASLFPGEPEQVQRDKSIYRSVLAVKPPPWRVTLGYQVIAAAREVWVLASGPGKENALKESLNPSGQTPLANVLRSRNHTRIFSDIPN